MKRIVLILGFMLTALSVYAQKDFGGTVSFDSTVYDFGKVNIKDGAVSCSFKVTNTGKEPINIYVVTSSCSCTTASWTREDIAPGESGTISVKYTNDEGPYPFDKALTVYLSCLEKPVILHVKGTAFNGRKKK